MVNTLTNWLVEEHAEAEEPSSRRLHLHFLHSPVEIHDDAANPGKVAGIKFERMQLDGTGNVKGTGEFLDYPVQAVYRAIGYHGSPLDELEYDARRGVIPNEGGRVLDADGQPRPRHLRHRLDQARPGRADRPHQGRRAGDHRLPARGPADPAAGAEPGPAGHHRAAGGARHRVHHVGRLDQARRPRAGPRRGVVRSAAADGVVRERIKVVPREDMIEISRA